MATRITVSGGRVDCVYDDRFRPLLEKLGMPFVTRVSDVEFDHNTQEWYAKYIPTGQEIARGKNRNEVIEAEVKWLESRVSI